MDCQELYQKPSILPPMTVDEGKVGVDSDHQGVEVLPRSNLATKGSNVREEFTVQPFTESGMAEFGYSLISEDWRMLEDSAASTSDIVSRFEEHSRSIVNAQFPTKTVFVGIQDLPYFTEELRKLKRKKQRAYRKGKRSQPYIQAKALFDEKMKREVIKYREKILKEVREGKKSSGYTAIRKLGNGPGEEGKQRVVVGAFSEMGLTDQQSANRMAYHCSAISNTVKPLDIRKSHPALQLAI